MLGQIQLNTIRVRQIQVNNHTDTLTQSHPHSRTCMRPLINCMCLTFLFLSFSHTWYTTLRLVKDLWPFSFTSSVNVIRKRHINNKLVTKEENDQYEVNWSKETVHAILPLQVNDSCQNQNVYRNRSVISLLTRLQFPTCYFRCSQHSGDWGTQIHTITLNKVNKYKCY